MDADGFHGTGSPRSKSTPQHYMPSVSCSDRLPQVKISHAGWMRKKGGWPRRWRRRYFQVGRVPEHRTPLSAGEERGHAWPPPPGHTSNTNETPPSFQPQPPPCASSAVFPFPFRRHARFASRLPHARLTSCVIDPQRTDRGPPACLLRQRQQDQGRHAE